MKHRGLLYLYCLFICLTHHGRSDAFIVAAYYESWSIFEQDQQNTKPLFPKMIDPFLLDDLYFAFAIFGFVTESIDPNHPHLTGDFTIQPIYAHDQTLLYKEFQKLKQQSASKLNTLLSIGGANFNNPNDPYGMGKHTYKLFSQMVANPKTRRQFITSAIAYAHKYGFDGIDIDWEYPGDLTRGGQPADFTHFIEFLKECSAAFHAATPPLMLSFAAPAFIPAGVPKNYHEHPDHYFQWLAACSQYVDRITVMAYNYHTPDSGQKLAGVNAPLYQDTNPESPLYIAKTLENYLNNGTPANKILLGLPVYGWLYRGMSDLPADGNGAGKSFQQPRNKGSTVQEPGFLSYFDIADRIRKDQLQQGIDATTNTAFAYDRKNQLWLSFDIPDTIALKVQEAKKKNLQGVIFWAVNLDEYRRKPRFPNIRAADKLKN